MASALLKLAITYMETVGCEVSGLHAVKSAAQLYVALGYLPVTFSHSISLVSLVSLVSPPLFSFCFSFLFLCLCALAACATTSEGYH